MLVRFIVSNFMSFKEETEFNMLPASGQKRLKEHIYSAGGIDVLKMAAIYGANGAGKSNLVKAIGAMKNILVKADFSTIKKFKLDKEYLSKPTTFEIEFTQNDNVYSYKMSVDSNSIIEESLYETGAKNEILVFNRTTKNSLTNIDMGDEYKQTPEDILRIKLYQNELLKNDVCLLKMLAESGAFKKIGDAYMRINGSFLIVKPTDNSSGIAWALHNNSADIKKFLNDNICSVNAGIVSITTNSLDANSYFGKDKTDEVDELKNRIKNKDGAFVKSNERYAPYAVIEKDELIIKEVISIHKSVNGEDVNFNILEESDGTLRLLDILPWVNLAIGNGLVLIIDEIEQSIHVNLIKELISKFSKENNTSGQLIFTTHESNLLDQDILRQDEIWFAEKSPAGETGFYPLSDYEIRSDLDIRKGYLNGRFGAVPFLANLHDLNWDKYGKDEA